jgi:hypothetical protein
MMRRSFKLRRQMRFNRLKRARIRHAARRGGSVAARGVHKQELPARKCDDVRQSKKTGWK